MYVTICGSCFLPKWRVVEPFLRIRQFLCLERGEKRLIDGSLVVLVDPFSCNVQPAIIHESPENTQDISHINGDI